MIWKIEKRLRNGRCFHSLLYTISLRFQRMRICCEFLLLSFCCCLALFDIPLRSQQRNWADINLPLRCFICSFVHLHSQWHENVVFACMRVCAIVQYESAIQIHTFQITRHIAWARRCVWKVPCMAQKEDNTRWECLFCQTHPTELFYTFYLCLAVWYESTVSHFFLSPHCAMRHCYALCQLCWAQTKQAASLKWRIKYLSLIWTICNTFSFASFFHWQITTVDM